MIPGALAPLALAAAGLFPGLGEPEVVKSDWNQRALTVADVDGDGRADLLYINNDKARVEILLQRKPGEAPRRKTGSVEGLDRWTPRLEDARFESAPLTTATFMYDLAAGDIDGDGRTDIVVTEKSRGLLLFRQTAPLTWADPVPVDIKDVVTYLGLLLVRDVDGNGRPEIVASTPKTLCFYEWDKAGRLSVARKLNHSEENLYGLRLVDLDGNGLPDLQLCSTDKQYSLRVRLQEKPGVFGPEMMIRQDPAEGILSVGQRKGDAQPFFAMLQKASGMVELFQLRPPGPGPATDASGSTPFAMEAFSAPVTDKDKPVLTAWADLDGNGWPDLAVTDHAGAQVHVYFQDEQGRLAASQAYPSLSSIASLAAADTDGDGRAELFLCSTSEETVGVARLQEDQRLTFPESIRLEGIPTAVATGDLEGDGKPELFCATRSDKAYRVVILRGEGRGAARSWKAAATAEVSVVSHDIERILPVDIDPDGRLDLALAASFKPLQFLVQTGALQFAEVRDLNGYSKSLVNKVTPGGLSLADLNGDGKLELLVTRKGFVRALRMTPDRQLEVVDQLNASDPQVEVDAALALPGKDGVSFLLADSAHNCFESLTRDNRGLFTLREKIQLPSVRIKGGEVFTSRDGAHTVFLASNDKFWRVALNRQSFLRHRLALHECDLPDVTYGGVELGDLNADGQPDLIVADTTQTRVLEVLSVEDDWSVVSRYHFKVFDSEPGQRQASGGREPKELVVGDFTGDGKNDIAVLVHDRVLMYPQP